MESIYHKPIHEISWDDVDQFCMQGIKEGAFLDYKRQVPERLENTIAAMANTIGGVIFVGIEEDAETKPKMPIEGIPFTKGLSEQVMNIVLSNITPPVFPEIHEVLSDDKKRVVIIIRIHQSHETPHAIADNTRVYLRTGNRNKPEEIASVDKIEWLLNGRRRSENLRTSLYERAEKRFDAMRIRAADHNPEVAIESATLRFSSCPLFPMDIYKKPPELKRLMYDVRVQATNDLHGLKFPATNTVTLVDDAALANRSNDEGGFCHTELNSFGLFFYKQKLTSASHQHGGIESTEVFARLDEFFDSARIFYGALGYLGPLHVRISLEKIGERKLIGYLEATKSLGGEYVSVDPHVVYEQVAMAHSLGEQKSMLIQNAVERIGWTYNWSVTPELLNSYYEFNKPKPVK